MRLAAGGQVEVVTGVADQGGGAYTVLRRVAAAVMSVDPQPHRDQSIAIRPDRRPTRAWADSGSRTSSAAPRSPARSR